MLAVAAVINIRERCTVVHNCERRICEVLHGSYGNVAGISGRAGNFRIVGIIRKDVTVTCKVAGIVRHGVFVTCGDADDNTRFVELLVYIAEHAFELIVIYEAARRADRHIDRINAEEVAIFKCRHVDTGVRAGRLIGEDLHEDELCKRSGAHEFDRTVGVDCETGDRTGNVRTVSVIVRYIVIPVIIVIGERDLCGQVLALDGGFNGGNILFGKRGLGNDAVILECFMTDVQTGVQNCNDHSVAIETDVLHRVCAGDDVCIFLRRRLRFGSVILVRDIDLLYPIHLLHNGKVFICRLDGHTVHQSRVIIQALCIKRQRLEEGVMRA